MMDWTDRRCRAFHRVLTRKARLYTEMVTADAVVFGPRERLIGFESDEDWFEYRLEHHPEFLGRIQEARAAIRAGRGIRLEDLPR